MTTIYFIRNAECENLQDATSEFSAEGQKELTAIQGFFHDQKLDAVYLSSQKNAAKTMEFITNKEDIPVYVTEEFNERKIGQRVANLTSFSRRQWAEQEYKLNQGENLIDVQDRMIDGLEKVVTINKDQTTLICTHSFALATLIQFFDETFSFEEYQRTNSIRPWIVKMEFDGKTLLALEEIRCV